MASVWPNVAQDPSASEPIAEFARIWMRMPKVVFSTTLQKVEHNNRLAGPDIQAEVATLKEQVEGGLGVCGAILAASFMPAPETRGPCDPLRHPGYAANGEARYAPPAMQEQSPPSRRKGLQLEVAVSGMIGLLALMVSAYTVYVQRQQLKVQAWPRLALVGETRQGPGEDDVRLTLSIQNRGLAPAEIRWMRVSVAGEAVNDWLEWLRHLARRQGVTNVDSDLETSDSPVGSVISVGGEAPLFTARSRRDLAVILADNETAISICYCSVLDDWWMHEALEGGGDRVSQQERE